MVYACGYAEILGLRNCAQELKHFPEVYRGEEPVSSNPREFLPRTSKGLFPFTWWNGA